MIENTMVIQVDASLESAFTEAAIAADLTASQLLRNLMQDYLRRNPGTSSYDEWIVRKIAAARVACRNGQTVENDDVTDYFAVQRAAHTKQSEKHRS